MRNRSALRIAGAPYYVVKRTHGGSPCFVTDDDYLVYLDYLDDATARHRCAIHAYVLLPMRRGFYVIVYPATRDGYALYEPQFNQLVNSFTPLKEGPDGAALAAAPVAAVRKKAR